VSNPEDKKLKVLDLPDRRPSKYRTQFVICRKDLGQTLGPPQVTARTHSKRTTTSHPSFWASCQNSFYEERKMY